MKIRIELEYKGVWCKESGEIEELTSVDFQEAKSNLIPNITNFDDDTVIGGENSDYQVKLLSIEEIK